MGIVDGIEFGQRYCNGAGDVKHGPVRTPRAGISHGGALRQRDCHVAALIAMTEGEGASRNGGRDRQANWRLAEKPPSAATSALTRNIGEEYNIVSW